MSTALTLYDRVYSVEKDFNQVNNYRLNFAKEAQFALQLIEGSDSLYKAAQNDPAALEYAIINLASIGISLNPAVKEAYLVPRGGKICLDISYIGLVKLATDTGSVLWVQAEIVKKNDKFEYMGVGKSPVHQFDPFADRGEMIGVYTVAKLSTGECLSTIMSKAECEDIKTKSSQAASSGPWKTFYDEMCKKTVIKRASKLWPKSVRLDTAVQVLNEHEGIDFAPKPHMDQPTAGHVPGEETFKNLRDLLKIKGKTEEGLLNYLTAQSGGEVIAKIEDMNSAQIEYAYRMLGGAK